ncbi:MAG TPA: DUF4160 domain-containing protein [Devosiaceae bacterium]|nr:DUF4160 domain-containing protein [Devosiaceae bacterium]
MPTLARLGNGRVLIRVFARDHMPRHFHITTPDGDVQVSIDDLALLNGKLRRGDLELALRWAVLNQHLISELWDQLNGRIH